MDKLRYKLRIGKYPIGDIIIRELTATENKSYIPKMGEAFGPVHVQVPTPELEDITITQNGTTTAPDGKGFKTVTTDVRPTLQSKVATQNGIVRADEGYDGLEEVDVRVPAPEVVLQSKTVTPSKETQTVSADSGYTALETVEVEPIPNVYQDVSAVTASASDVLSGKKIVDSEGNVVDGEIESITSGQALLIPTKTKYTIPKGYHTGEGTVEIMTETKTVTPTSEQQEITPTRYHVLSSVIVEAVPDRPDPILQDKTVTENGTYEADLWYDGLGKVTVNVQPTYSVQGETLFISGMVESEVLYL